MTTSLTPLPRKHAFALSLARGLARRHLRQETEGFVVVGADEARAALAAGPVLFCANHLSAHDAFAMVAVDEALGSDGRCLIDEDTLARLPFFRALGAVPLSQRAPRRALAQLKDAATWLSAPGRALWIFPQGRHVPSWRRPLGFQRGFLRLLRRAPTAVVVPVSLLLVFRDAERPLLLLRCGAPLPADVDGDAVEAAVADGIDALDAAVATSAAPAPLIAGRGGNGGDGLGARLLSAFVRASS